MFWDIHYLTIRKRVTLKRVNEKYDYKEYVRCQRYRTKIKWGGTQASVDDFQKRFNEMWLKVKHLFKEDIVIGCMGIRDGAEYTEFKRLLPKAKVYGVDIYNEVENVGENCFCYDFNKLPKDWGNKFDLLYSNSVDHAYNIEETIKEWRRVVKDDGYLLISFSTADLTYADLYKFEKEDVKKLFPDNKVEIICEWENDFCALIK